MKNRIRIVFAACVLTLACAVSPFSANGSEMRPSGGQDYAATKGAPAPDAPDAAPNEILVRFKSATGQQTMARIAATKKIEVKSARTLKGTDWQHLTFYSGRPVKELVEAYRSDPNVLFAEPNYYVYIDQTQSIPNDPQFYQLWGLHNTGQSGGTPDADIDAPGAWDYATDSNVIVAVIDTGVDYNHPDLAANMWTNPGEIPGNGVDDDHNGYIDDYRGWDFVNGDNNPFDDVDHGTHVSGTIGAVGNNGVGVAGVCWRVKIMPLKFISADGFGSDSDAIDAINYAVAMGAKVLNNSWGGSGYSQALKDAISAADAAGVLFVAASGNYGANSDTDPLYPAAYNNPNIIAVASTSRNDALSYFSNYGVVSVDLAAPGEDIFSTVPGNSYESLNGTSMATPHVSGACALLWAVAGTGAAHTEIKRIVLDGAEPKSALTGKCVTGGRLNLFNSLGRIMVRRLRLTSPNGGEGIEAGCAFDVTWSATGLGWTSGDTVFLDYSDDGGANWTAITGADNLSYNLGTFSWDTTGLALGGSYRVRVSCVQDNSARDSSDGNFAISGPLAQFEVAISSPQRNGRPFMGACRVTAQDEQGRPISTLSVFNTDGRFPVAMSAPDVTIGGLSGPGNELVATDFQAGFADLALLGMTAEVATLPADVVFTATSADGKTGVSDNVTIVGSPDYFTESFDISDQDLAYHSITFVPDGSEGYYLAHARAISAFPTDPAGGADLAIANDLYSQVNLSGGRSVRFFGSSYGRIYIGSNGYITFGSGDTQHIPSLANHFSKPRISALICDLNQVEAGTISWKQLSDRVAVTYANVTEYHRANQNSFQIELLFDGRIVISWLRMDTKRGIAGLSRGLGTPSDFIPSDLSSYAPKWDLVVSSAPAFGIPFAGSPSGLTYHLSILKPDSAVLLTVSSTAIVSGRYYFFVKWTLNGAARPLGSRTLQFAIARDTTAIANYKAIRYLKIAGRTTVYGSTTNKYTCRAYYTNGTSADVTTKATWRDNTRYARFSAPGRLKTYVVRSDRRCAITASYCRYSRTMNILIRRR